MAVVPPLVTEFLAGRRFAVAGVSRDGRQPANAIFRKLVKAGYEVVPVNPGASDIEGVRCYPSLTAVEGPLDGVVVVTPPSASLRVVQDAAAASVPRVWLHRSVGQGSVSEDAVAECRARGLACIAGGCPMMYCEPVDIAHRCMRWLLKGRLPR